MHGIIQCKCGQKIAWCLDGCLNIIRVTSSCGTCDHLKSYDWHGFIHNLPDFVDSFD